MCQAFVQQGNFVSFDVGVAYFNLFNLGRSAGDVLRPYFDFGKTFKLGDAHTLTPYFRTEVMIPVKWNGLDARKGAHLFLGVKHQWDLFERLTVNQKFAFMYDTGTFVKFDHGFIGDYDIGLGWKITDKVSVVVPTFRVIVPLSDLKDGRKTNTVFGSGITFKF